MSKILFIVDPIAGGTSVQFRLFKKLSINLSKEHQIYITSIFFDERKRRELESLGLKVITPKREQLFLQKLFSYFGKDNESMLWVESWLREGLLRKNSTEMEMMLKGEKFDYIINATNTVPIKAHIWWIQGPPLATTLESIRNENRLVKIALIFAKRLITRIDSSLIRRSVSASTKRLAISKYCYQVYSSKGMKVDGILYTTPGFDDFKSTTDSPSRDYVLAYIGKETDLSPLVKMAEQNIRIKAFGSKLPLGANLETLKNMIDYKGFVSREELISLYSNALFTAFPFTTEALGWVPLESIACGTPVLTYNKQGPSETIIDQETGWLVDNPDEFVKKAVEIWNRKKTNISQQNCVNGVRPFSVEYIVNSLLEYLSEVP